MQPDLPTANPLNWTGLSGAILPGGYELKELLEADGAAAQFRVRVLGDRELDAVAQFISVSPEEIRRQVDGWQLVRELRHATLMLPLGTGEWERDDHQLGYLVLRRPDESLGGVLKERALTYAEAKEVVFTLLHGLETLHVNGLVHGCLSPEQVLAVGDSIQLSVACVRNARIKPEIPLVNPKYIAPESEDPDGEAGENVTAESDVWCLGATVFECLTGKGWTEESREETAALPEPFATIALRCLEDEPASRCKLPEAVALLKGEIKPAPRVKAAAAGATPVQLETKSTEVAVAKAETPTNRLSPEITTSSVPPPQAAVEAKATSSAAVETSVEARIPLPSTAVPSTTVPASKASTSSLSAAAAAPAFAPTAAPTRSPNSSINVPPTAKRSESPLRSVAAPGSQPASRSFSSSAALRSQGTQSGRTRALHAATRPTKVPRGAVSTRWIWVAVAAIVVLLLVWALRPKAQSSSAIGAAPQSSVAKTLPEAAKQPGRSGETKVLQPDGTAVPKVAPPPARTTESKPAANAPPASSVGAASTRGDVWHVILYTYGRSEDATRMAETLNSRHPNLNAQVFAAKENEGPFLVTAGGSMSRDEAVQTRRKAVGSGLPRDSYIQNFKR